MASSAWRLRAPASRSPGARPESIFLAAYVRCGQCVEVCPYDTLNLADLAEHKDIRMGTAVIDTELCWAHHGTVCRSCFHACPEGVLGLGLGRQGSQRVRNGTPESAR